MHTTFCGRSELRTAGAFVLALLAALPAAADDCNLNLVPDDSDIAVGTSLDCNRNGVPDECETRLTFVLQSMPSALGFVMAVAAADFDDDGDVDVAAASTSKLAWHENLDGEGGFGPEHTVSGLAGITSLAAADLDGDGDQDILFSSSDTGGPTKDSLGWHENRNGDGGFGRAQVIAVPPAPQTVRAADMDGDGDLDVLVAYGEQVLFPVPEVADRVVWYENLDGSGTFGEERLVTAQIVLAEQAFSADVDADGDVDVLSVSSLDDKLAWYENSGQGQGWPQRILSEGVGSPEKIVAADFDGDLDADAVVSSTLSAGPLLYFEFQEELGSYGPAEVIISGVSSPFHLIPADLDGDGDLDVVTSGDGFVWYENDGGGSFGPPQDLAGNGHLAADIDGDGDLDFFGSGSGGLGWNENTTRDCNDNGVPDDCDIALGSLADCDADGAPDSCQMDTSPIDCNGNSTPDSCDIASAGSSDCSGNGVPDECEPDCNGNALPDSCDILGQTSQDCSGNGVPDECEPDCNGNALPDSCELNADLDGNGVPDSCDIDCNGNGKPDGMDLTQGAPNCNGNSIPDACEGDCDDSSTPDACDTAVTFFGVIVDSLLDGPRVVRSADFDLDGDLDLVSGHVGGACCRTSDDSVCSDDMICESAVCAALPQCCTGPWIQACAQKAQTVSSCGCDDVLAWHPNNGIGQFPGAGLPISTLLQGVRGLVAADLDGDLDPDVVSASESDGKVLFYPNVDHGSFGPPQVVTAAASGVREVAAADVDGDGDLDLVVAATDADALTWHENLTGTGTSWAAVTILSGAGRPTDLALADVDGDHDPDVISLSETDGAIVWHENDGLGGFGPPQAISTTEPGNSYLVVADLDGDLDADLAVSVASDFHVFWQENLGGGIFSAQTIVQDPVFGLDDIRAADVDGDGDRDLVAAAHQLLWFENLDGRGAFAPARSMDTLSMSATSIEPGDYDGDGDTDFAATSDFDFISGSDSVEIWRNESDDCNGNGVPDSCEPDCDANGIADGCDLRAGRDRDCNGNGVPDGCDSACASCDADGDGCADDLDATPGDSATCGDSDGDSCDDCASGVYDALHDGTDADADGFCAATDCDDANAETWADPGPFFSLTLRRSPSGTLLDWTAPLWPGATLLRYDTLRSSAASDFLGPAVCVESDDTVPGAAEIGGPDPGELFYYLVRVENACPNGAGSLGTDSNGVPRVGLACP